MKRIQRRAAKKRQQGKSGSIANDLLGQAIKNHQQGNLAVAEHLYRDILHTHPQHPDACHFLGVLHHQTGRSELAVDFIKQAISQAPSYTDAYNNLGNVYKEIGELEKAIIAYRMVVSLSPNHSSALNNLGVALKELGKADEAIQCLQKAIALEPHRADFFHNLGNAYRKQGDFQKSADSFRHSIALQPYQADAYKGLYRTYYIAGHFDEAGKVLRQWLEFDPNNPFAKHQYAAFMNETPERASDEYVQSTFDNFAGTFDQVLARLNYRAPELVTKAVATVLPSPKRDKLILDAGCGTGLCGPLLRPYASKLVGVDLSPKMLAKATGRQVYEELVEAELVGYIAQHPATFDLIVSADTLVYFGDLNQFLQAVKKALLPGGHLVFTLEKEDSGPGFKLNMHGRYSHTRDYIESILTVTGFQICAIESETLRKESGKPVSGLVVTAGQLLF